MPRVTMPEDHPADELTVNGQRIKPGQSAEVSDDAAVSYAEQGWSIAGADLPSKDDLLAIAAERGVEVKPSWSKQKIADALDAAPANPEAPQGADTQEP
jgi:hypothetical protein